MAKKELSTDVKNVARREKTANSWYTRSPGVEDGHNIVFFWIFCFFCLIRQKVCPGGECFTLATSDHTRCCAKDLHDHHPRDDIEARFNSRAIEARRLVSEYLKWKQENPNDPFDPKSLNLKMSNRFHGLKKTGKRALRRNPNLPRHVFPPGTPDAYKVMYDFIDELARDAYPQVRRNQLARRAASAARTAAKKAEKEAAAAAVDEDAATEDGDDAATENEDDAATEDEEEEDAEIL